MTHYRVYFLKEDRAVAPEDIVASDDGDAMLQAGHLLTKSSFASIEIWQATRLVGSLARQVSNVAVFPN